MDYRAGWINVDVNPCVMADIHDPSWNLRDIRGNSISHVWSSHMFEHLRNDQVWQTFDELYRICEHDARVEITVPHFKSIHAYHPKHFTFWTVSTPCVMEVADIHNPNHEKCTNFKCKIEKIRLHFWTRHTQGVARRLKLYRLGGDWFWNLGGFVWQQFMERFQIFGFDEVYYCVRVQKR